MLFPTWEKSNMFEIGVSTTMVTVIQEKITNRDCTDKINSDCPNPLSVKQFKIVQFMTIKKLVCYMKK
jgi:hypothetical protein